MKHTTFPRCLAMALALLLTIVLPVTALADTGEIIELVATDITLDETHFEYTGEEIRPNVTVRVQDQLLTLDQDYTLEFRDNVEVGTAAVVVTGIPEKGYTGTVEHPFFIDPKTSDDSQETLITIIGTDVTIDGTEFIATGEAIEPAITVTVDGKTLTAGEEYTLVYENNTEPGTGSVTVTGVEEKGYTGSVTIHFTIQAAPETPTEPEQTPPQETEPEETQPVSYKITAGNGAIWHKDSGKTLSFTVEADPDKFTSLQVDGKTVNKKYYTLAQDSTRLTLHKDFLQHLELGSHKVTVKFTDGEAEGIFKISAPADESNPKTGDGFALHTWTAILFMSLTGILGAAFAGWKKFRK